MSTFINVGVVSNLLKQVLYKILRSIVLQQSVDILPDERLHDVR